MSSRNKVGGLILHAPIASGHLLVNPLYHQLNDDKNNDDPFCNWKIDPQINEQVFLIYGQDDNIIPSEHSLSLSERIIHLIKWYSKKGNHNTIYTFFDIC